MKGEIIGEDEADIGVLVTDNAGEKHQVEMHKHNGEIYAHDQDGYPDNPHERTEEGNEHVNQARRFAKYWVYRKRGYDTLESRRNPDRILATVIALAPLTSETTEEYIGDLYQQFRSIHGDATPAVGMPDGVEPGDAVYLKDVYLGLGDGGLGAAAAELIGDQRMMNLVGRSVGVGGDQPLGAEFAPEFHELLAEATDTDPESLSRLQDGLLVDAVSGIHVQYGSLDNPTTEYGEQPALEREPDARIEMYPYDIDTLREFQVRVANHLICQVRDCYLLMGIAPPEPFRIRGPGLRDANGWYNSINLYEMYWNPDAEISTWFEEHTPERIYDHDADSNQDQSTD